MSPPQPDPPAPEHLTLDIELSVQDGLAAAWDEPRIVDLVRSIVGRELGAAGSYAISLHLVDDATIRAMNAEHRATDARTDVLSFPLLDAAGPGFILPPAVPAHLGDVVVSYPRAVAQAAEYGHTTDREVGYLVAHGVLHVLGYDHEDDTDRARMRQREEEALRPLGFIR